MSYVAGDTVTLWIPLRDSSGAVITDADDSDFTETLRHLASDGAITVPTVSSWSHIANGLYSATISNGLAGRYVGAVDYAGPPVQPFGFDVEVLSAAPAITTVSPVSVNTGDVEINQGDTYSGASALPWSTTDASQWPTLTGATIRLVAEHRDSAGNPTLECSGTVVTATGANKAVTVTVDGSDTDTLVPGTYDYQVIARIAGEDATLVTGTLTLVARVA